MKAMEPELPPHTACARAIDSSTLRAPDQDGIEGSIRIQNHVASAIQNTRWIEGAINDQDSQPKLAQVQTPISL